VGTISGTMLEDIQNIIEHTLKYIQKSFFLLIFEGLVKNQIRVNI